MTAQASDKEVQLKLRFGEPLRVRLAESGERNGSSLNSEIIRRVQDSYTIEDAQGGAATSALVQAIVADIAEIERITGKSWAEDAETYAATRSAVIAAILDREPLRIENEEAARPALANALKQAKDVNLYLSLLAGPIDLGAIGSSRQQVETMLAKAEAVASEANDAADKVLQPHFAALRRGRELHREIRRRRREARDKGRPR